MTSQLLNPYHLITELLGRSLSKTFEPIEKHHRYALISVHGDPSAQLGKDGVAVKICTLSNWDCPLQNEAVKLMCLPAVSMLIGLRLWIIVMDVEQFASPQAQPNLFIEMNYFPNYQNLSKIGSPFKNFQGFPTI